MTIPPLLHADALNHIFSFLENDRQTLGAVRLCSRAFRNTSSPYFITQALLAPRPPNWVRFLWLSHHEYFRHTVKEFIYDSESPDGHSLGQFAAEAGELTNAERQLCRPEHRLPEDLSDDLDRDDKVLLRQMRRGTAKYLDTPNNASARWLVRHWFGSEGFEFQRLFEQGLVSRAFGRFTRLRRVSMTDSSLISIVERLQGRLLADGYEVPMVVAALQANPQVTVRGLSIGGSRCTEVTGRSQADPNANHAWSSPPCLSLGNMGQLWRLVHAMTALKRLDLSFMSRSYQYWDILAFVRTGDSNTLKERTSGLIDVLLKVAPQLTHLSLHHGDNHSHDPPQDEPTEWESGRCQMVKRDFTTVLQDLRFEQLQHLKLSGWIIRPAELMSFLLKHKKTLSGLQLQQNLMFRSATWLPQWIADEMTLSRVDVDNIDNDHVWTDEELVAMEADCLNARKVGDAED